jgi:hypothetical protein
MEIGGNLLCLGIVVCAAVVLGIAAWRGNWPS